MRNDKESNNTLDSLTVFTINFPYVIVVIIVIVVATVNVDTSVIVIIVITPANTTDVASITWLSSPILNLGHNLSNPTRKYCFSNTKSLYKIIFYVMRYEIMIKVYEFTLLRNQIFYFYNATWIEYKI